MTSSTRVASRHMGEIPSVDELAEVIGQAQSGGQPLSAEQLAAVVHEAVMARKRRVHAERALRSYHKRRAEKLAAAS